ncbi:MAG: adenosine deaminase [Opitutales bacterium]
MNSPPNDAPNAANSPEPAQGTSPNRREFLQLGALSILGAGAMSSSLQASPTASAPATVVPAVARTQLRAQTISGTAQSQPDSIAAVFEEVKKKGTNTDLYRFLFALPKAGDIHHHLGGGILPDVMYEIAADPDRNGGQRFFTRYRVDTSVGRLPFIADHTSQLTQWLTLHEKNYEKLSAAHKAQFKEMGDLTDKERAAWEMSIVLDKKGEEVHEFFEYHWPRLGDLLNSIDYMAEALLVNMEQFGQEKVRYLEIQDDFRGKRDADWNELSPEDATDIWKERLRSERGQKTGVDVRFQMIVLRFAPNALERVEDTFAWLEKERDQWVGMNMAGREDNNDGHPRRFTETYDRMLKRYPEIGISIHAGESQKYDSHIFDTLRLGAQRIGHGINLFRDEPTFQMMRGGPHLIEINLVSNHLLGYVPEPLEHPFGMYLRQGIPVCLNTDDRGMWSSNMTDEYYSAVRYHNVSWKELDQMARDSLTMSFAEPSLKEKLLADYQSELQSFTDEVMAKGWKQVCDATPATTHLYGERFFSLKL